MNSLMMFILGVIAMALGITATVFKYDFKKMKSYFLTEDGKGVLTGIVLFVLIGIGIAMLSIPVHAAEGKYFAYGEVYLGMDRTFKASPQCDPGIISDKLTSNGGVRINLYQSADKRFEFNTKYTHHSCAFNSDSKSYDAAGVELTYRFWDR